MIKKIIILTIVLMFIGFNAYAQGDLSVNGSLGVGTSSPSHKVEVVATDDRVKLDITKSADSLLTAFDVIITDNVTGSTSGVTSMDFRTQHTGNAGNVTQNFLNSQYWLDMRGSVSGAFADVRVQGNNLSFFGTGTYSLGNIEGIFVSTQLRGSTNVTANDFYLLKTGMNLNMGSGTESLTVTDMGGLLIDDWGANGAPPAGTQTNVMGIKVNKQTIGINKMGIWLNGDEAGADIVFGLNQEARLYSREGELFVKDSGSNETQISPHDPETGEWIFFSKNTKTGRTVKINMEKLVKAVEELTGEQFMIESFGKEE
jgi:hypothetical protein